MSKYDQGKGTATYLLQHYLKEAWQATGLQWTSDNDAEVEDLVDALVNAAKKELKEKTKV